MNLGYVRCSTALRQSILWSTAASQAAGKLGAHFAEQKALGNLGWAYYRMGDTDKSLSIFSRRQSRRGNWMLRMTWLKWLRALGMVSQEMNQTAIAEDYYKQALLLAQRSEDKEDLVDTLTALATISVERQKWDQATRYSAQAMSLSRSRGDRAGELDAQLVEGKIAVHQNDVDRASQLFSEVADDQQSETSQRWEAQENLARLYEDDHRPADAARQYKLSLATLNSARVRG